MNLLHFSSLKRITKISTINKLICGVVNNLQNAFGQKLIKGVTDYVLENHI